MAYEEMKCPKCKAAVSENAKFCTACGTKLTGKKKESRPKWWLIVIVLGIGFFVLKNTGVLNKVPFIGDALGFLDDEKVKWEDLVLADKLPRPDHQRVDSVWDNSEEELHVILDGVSEANNTAFNAACKEMGYNIDVEYSGSSIDAYNEEGYHLDTTYWSSGSLTLELKAPMKMEVIHWPQMGLAQKLPVPEAEIGKINYDRSDFFSVYVGKTDLTQFNAYIDACIEKGFTIDYSRGEKYYNAYNKDGMDLHVGYEGGNVMLVYISVPDEDDEYEEEETKPVKTPKPTATPKPTENTEPGIPKIKMTDKSTAYRNMDKAETEKIFKDMGFTDVSFVEVITEDTAVVSGAVTTVKANSKFFEKGDSFSPDTKIEIVYLQYQKPISEYEKAFVRRLSNYNLYYMFDTDTKQVVTFGTQDTYVDKGTYSGNFNSGVTIKWNHGEWTEKFSQSNGSSYAVMIDGNGFDWSYQVCDIMEAQEILNELQ